jgi:hypothetical protein
MALWTGLTLKLDGMQHPRLVRHTFRMPQEDSGLSRAWRRLRGEHPTGLRVQVERRPQSTIWVRLEGSLAAAGARKLAADLRRALEKRKERVVLDLGNLAQLENDAPEGIAEGLRAYRERIRIVAPRISKIAALVTLFGLYQ